jgi:hypothetical protein
MTSMTIQIEQIESWGSDLEAGRAPSAATAPAAAQGAVPPFPQGARTNDEYKPRFANTAEELVFFTNTDEVDYPIYLLPSREIVYKRKPEVERYASFHVKRVKEVKGTSLNRDYLNDIIAAFPSLPLKEVVEAARAVVGEYDFYVYHLTVTYEVYKGDYKELLGEYEVPYALVVVHPHYSMYAPEKQQFAITYSTLKRLLTKLPENVRAYVESRAYVAKVSVRKHGSPPVIKIKLPMPPPEFEKVFTDVIAWLTAPAEESEAEEEPEDAAEPELPIEVEEVLKPRELEVELEQPPVATTAASTAPSKSELVKIYLLSMRLPSKYLVQQVEYNESKTSVREVRSWAGDAARKASRLESIRREAYSKISRIFCYVEEYGTWIAVSDKAVEEAKKVSAFVVEELRKLGLDHFAERYTVKAIQVYLAPEDAKELLHAAVSHLSADVEELKQKIAEAEREQNKAALRRLEREKSYREALLAALRNYLAQLG